MDSEKPLAIGVLLLTLALVAGALLAACAGAPRFPLRDPMVRDDDERPMPNAPPEYISPFAWDGANNLVFRR